MPIRPLKKGKKRTFPEDLMHAQKVLAEKKPNSFIRLETGTYIKGANGKIRKM